MRYFLIALFSVMLKAYSQTGPWQAPLKICTSTNGVIFNVATTFQDSAGVPAVIRLGSPTSDTLMAAFQWFPAPKFSTYWDKIAVKFSYDGGTTWTAPKSCTFTGVPVGFQRPFDPGLVQLPSGQIRMYFSDGLNSPPPGGIDTYSGISNDGITYTVESSPRFDDATKEVIDPTVINFLGNYYYNAWSGTSTDGAYRAISNNGLTFTTQTTNAYDGSHLWLGNYLVDGSLLKFYGCGSNIWVNSSTNGTTWNTFTVTSISAGADPAVVKNKAGTYIMIYTGPPTPASVKDNNELDLKIKLYPSVFNTHFNVLVNDLSERLKIKVFDIQGKEVYTSVIEAGVEKTQVNLSHLAAGTYYCELSNNQNSISRKIIKAE